MFQGILATMTHHTKIPQLLQCCRQGTTVPKRFNSYWKLSHYYNLLGSKPECSAEQIKNSYLRLSKVYHPDNAETGNQAKFVRITEAYEKIKDAPLRAVKAPGHDEDLTHKAFIKTSNARIKHWTSKGPPGYYVKPNGKLYG